MDFTRTIPLWPVYEDEESGRRVSTTVTIQWSPGKRDAESALEMTITMKGHRTRYSGPNWTI